MPVLQATKQLKLDRMHKENVLIKIHTVFLTIDLI